MSFPYNSIYMQMRMSYIYLIYNCISHLWVISLICESLRIEFWGRPNTITHQCQCQCYRNTLYINHFGWYSQCICAQCSLQWCEVVTKLPNVNADVSLTLTQRCASVFFHIENISLYEIDKNARISAVFIWLKQAIDSNILCGLSENWSLPIIITAEERKTAKHIKSIISAETYVIEKFRFLHFFFTAKMERKFGICIHLTFNWFGIWVLYCTVLHWAHLSFRIIMLWRLNELRSFQRKFFFLFSFFFPLPLFVFLFW